MSPFNPESVAFEAGRIMLKRINDLLEANHDFAFETTLSTRSYVSFIKKARENGYVVTLVYFWLNSPEMAIERFAKRVSNGGHHIPSDVIERRYYRGIRNLVNLYIPICDHWHILDNVTTPSKMIAQSSKQLGETILNNDVWQTILKQSHEY